RVNVFALTAGDNHALALRDAAGGTIPVITAQPTSVSASQGQTVTFAGGLGGFPSPALHWRKNGVALSDPNRATYTPARAQPTDPQITLSNRTTAAVIASNDNWNSADAAVFTRVGAAPLGAGSKDAALVATLPPGSYVAQLTGVGATPGIALLEIFDADINRV